jgi:hypothetical protein
VPSSFSRFLADDELRRVRELYLKSIEDPSPEEPAAGADADAPAATQAQPEQDESAS